MNNILHNDTEHLNDTEIFNRYFNRVADEWSDRLPHLINIDPLVYVSRVKPSMCFPFV